MSDPEEVEATPRPSRARRIGIITAAVLIVAALVLIAIPVVAGVINGQPQKYASKQYQFSITFPAKPEVTTPAPGLTFVRWTGSNKSLSLQAHALSSAESLQKPDEVERSALKRASEVLSGNISQPITRAKVGGEDGYIVTFSIGGKDFVREAAVIHDGRFYALTMLNPTDDESAKFLDSFAFTS